MKTRNHQKIYRIIKLNNGKFVPQCKERYEYKSWFLWKCHEDEYWSNCFSEHTSPKYLYLWFDSLIEAQSFISNIQGTKNFEIEWKGAWHDKL